jgi:hypothetical protein
MKVTRMVETVIIEIDINDAEKIALILGNTVDLTDIRQESFQPLVEKMRGVGVRTDNRLYRASVMNGYPVIERSA